MSATSFVAGRLTTPIRLYSSASPQPQQLPEGASSQDLTAHDPESLEKTVRDAKQRFRDTLPRGYLTDEEYRLYERLYGPPLRETAPEDVGIPHHADMGSGGAPEGTYGASVKTTGTLMAEDGVSEAAEQHETDLGDGYVGIVARNKREYDALVKLEKDFKIAAEKAKLDEVRDAERRKTRAVDLLQEVEDHYTQEPQRQETEWDEEIIEAFGERARSHPLTEEGRFGPHPGTVQVPKESLVEPIAELLTRSDISHIKKAAEKAYGGPGLPDSAITPPGMRNRPMLPMTLQAGHHRMSEIDADAFIATYLPQMYAASRSVLAEVRKRLGTNWIRGLLTRNGGEGPRILDAGGAGAGLAAWQDIVKAEWDVMREEGLVKGPSPLGKRTVVIGSENLRQRVSRFLNATTFLPRLPNYRHSADNADKLLDAPEVPQPRKSFDVILAPHLLLQWPEGHRRTAILNSLWSLLSPEGGVLIVLEKGHPRGFEAVAQVRSKLLNEYILHPESQPDSEDVHPDFQKTREPGMIVAPCTNHKPCPMYRIPGKSAGRKDACAFSQRFIRPPFLHRIMDGKDRNHDDVEFSYLAIRRGVGLPDSVRQGDEAADRAVSAPMKRHGHILLDLCTPAGRIERWIVPQSFGRQAYRDARKAKWGDLWALGAKTRMDRKVRLGKGADVPDDGGVRARRARQTKAKVIEIGYDGSGLRDAVDKSGAVERRSKARRRLPRKALLEELMEE
ncbi:unnamed protein product [Parascedosporium putredinis]|uniref:Uncharacterized protein n=1 Tax=Parascedosporium putredinis TaxID=1442378 RepID=A0A9P1M7D7_9PEZI|nr:unnamed protein product [Parascedosporium putredinis]CAI7988227.1 unnamed protein product [Parascedosporium putredinis]